MFTFLLVGLFLYFFFNTVRFLHKVDEDQKAKLKAESQAVLEEEEAYSIVGQANRPKPKGKHCPLHNYIYDHNEKLFCTWCSKHPSQMVTE